MTRPNYKLSVTECQQKIQKWLGIPDECIQFQEENFGPTASVKIITTNSKHHQSFLFHEFEGIDLLEAYQKAIHYLENYYPTSNTYTLQWVKIGENELQTSYFRARNMQEVLDKFSFHRDLNQYNIYSITLNPIS